MPFIFAREFPICWTHLLNLAIQHHLSSSSLLEKKLVLELIKTYPPKKEKFWLTLWNSLDPAQNNEAALVPKAWAIFKIQSSSLEGSLLGIAECWTKALVCLQVVGHPDLSNYFLDQKELTTIFKDPSTYPLKWQA